MFKNRIKRVLSVVLAVVTLVTAVPGVSLAKEQKSQENDTGLNENFESGTIGKSADGWTLQSTNTAGGYDNKNDYTSNYKIVVEDDSRSGTKAMSIQGVSNVTKGYVVAQSDFVPVTGDESYSFEYALKIKKVESQSAFYGGRALVYQFDANKKLIKKTQVSKDNRQNMDWSDFATYIQTEKETAYVRVGFYIGGLWNKNKGIQVLVDNVAFELISDKEFLNGGFEKGSGTYDVYSWHLSSKSIRNENDGNNWAKNYTMVRDVNGYHGDCVAITRNGMGYVSLDSNIFTATPETSYVLDFAYAVENGIYETFYGMRAYVAQFDANKQLIDTICLNKEIRENTDWTELSYPFTTGKNTAYIQIQLWSGGVKDSNFTIRYDDVRLTKIVRQLSNDGICNGNFEEIYNGNVFDWKFSERAGMYWESTFDGYNNTKGIKVTKEEIPEHGYTSVKSNEFQVQENKDYKLVYMTRGDDLEGNCYNFAQVYFYDKDGKQISIVRDKARDHRPVDAEWQQVVNYYKVPQGATTCVVELLFCGTKFKYWVDDAEWSIRDTTADIYGFDAVDRDGKIAGWTVSQPAAVKRDTKNYHNGSASLFISQTLNTGKCSVILDELIPLQQESKYKFSLYIKSFDSDISSDGVRLYALTYDKDGQYKGKIEGIHVNLNSSSEQSDWREVFCGLNTGVDIAYVRLQLTIGAGTMNLWVDDLTWKMYDPNEYIESFDSVCEDGTPDGWNAVIRSGKPTFKVADSKVSISAETSEDQGILIGKWDIAQEYLPFKFSALYATSAGTKVNLSIKYFDFADREIEEQRIEKVMDSTNGLWEEYSFQFIFPSAKYALIEISNEGKGSVTIDGIQILNNNEVSDSDEITTWRGQWVWHQEDHYKCANSTRYFRRHFTVTDELETGTLQITVDDKVKLWINDVEIALESADDWESVKVVEELEQYLVVGDNVIAIEATNESSAAGLLYDGFVKTTNEERIDFYSDGQEVSSTVYVEGWNEKGFDDSSWTQTRVIGPAGTSPWSALEFDVSAFVSDEIEILEYNLTDEITCGADGTLTMTVVPNKDITKDIQFKASLWIRNTTKEMFTTSLEQLEGPPTSEWKAGEKITVKYRFQTPTFLSSGKYVLQLSRSQIRITNMDIIDNKFSQAIKITNDDEGVTVTSEMKELNGTQTLFINGEAQPNMFYVTPSYTSYLNETADGYMHDAGVCVTRMWTDGTWIGENEYDYTEMDRVIYKELQNHPDTYLIVTLKLDVPDWWTEENPDELIVINDGSQSGVSFASEKFVKEATESNLDKLEHMMQQGYANRIIGVALTSCRTSEWLWYADGQIAQDFSKPGLEAWRKWLKETYETDKALQKAWNRTSVTLDTATVPTFEERTGTTYSTLLDPATQRDTIDYATFMQDLVAQRLNDYSKTINEALDDRIIMGAYYGYLNNVYYYAASNTLHYGIEAVLENEDIDFFAGPSVYGERYDGQAGSYMQMVESVLAHDKALIVENDTRTSAWNNLSTEMLTRESMGPTYNVSDTLSQLERDFANQLTRGVGQWYYNMWGTWFEHQQYSDLIEIMYNERVVNQARKTEYQSDICYIIDEDMYTYMAYGDFNANYDVLYWLLFEQRSELARIGVSVDMYCMSDLEKGLVPDYKIYIMLSPIEMDESERAAAEKHLKNDNKTIVWQYISGASDGREISAKNMSDMIGMNVVFDTNKRELSATFAKKEHSLLQGIEGKFYGSTSGRKVVSPLGIINDKGATILGYMNDNPQQAAIAIKKMKDWTSIYSAVPCLPTEFFVNLLDESGIHRYSKNKNDVIFANDNYVAINTEYGGSKEISLDGTYSVYDVYGCKMYSMSTDTIKFDMEDNSTKLFRLMPENKLAVYLDTPSGGKSKQEGYKELSVGDDYACKIKADKGYVISAIIVDGVRTDVREESYTVKFNDLTNSHFVKAEFVLATEDVQEVSVDRGIPAVYIWLPVSTIVILGATLLVAKILKGRKRYEEEL